MKVGQIRELLKAAEELYAGSDNQRAVALLQEFDDVLAPHAMKTVDAFAKTLSARGDT